MQFLNLGLEDSVPDATTVWSFRGVLFDAVTSLKTDCEKSGLKTPGLKLSVA
jgi:hypothetical protein